MVGANGDGMSGLPMVRSVTQEACATAMLALSNTAESGGAPAGAPMPSDVVMGAAAE